MDRPRQQTGEAERGPKRLRRANYYHLRICWERTRVCEPDSPAASRGLALGRRRSGSDTGLGRAGGSGSGRSVKVVTKKLANAVEDDIIDVRGTSLHRRHEGGWYMINEDKIYLVARRTNRRQAVW